MSSTLRIMLLALGAALLLTGAALGYVFLTGAGEEGRNAPPPPSRVLVAAQPIAAGRILTRQDLAWRELGGHPAPRGALVEGASSELQVIGAFARRRIEGGELLTAEVVGRQDPGAALATALNPGWRALTVKADAMDTASGLLRPNDRVDIVYLRSVGEAGAEPAIKIPFIGGGGSGGDWSSRVLLQGVRVLAVNGKLDAKGGGKDMLGGGSITLEVRPPDADRLMVSSNSGRLGFVLRRPDEPLIETPRATPAPVAAHVTPRPAPRSAEGPTAQFLPPPPPPPAVIIRAAPPNAT